MGDVWLEVTQGRGTGSRLEVGRELVVGRACPDPARLAGDPKLSRSHARFWRAAGGELIVEDLGSANGTFVNGERIDRPAVLAVGGTVQLGDTTLLLRREQPTGSSGPSSAQATRVRPPPGLESGGPYAGVPPDSAPGGPSATSTTRYRRPLRLLALLVLLLVIAVAGLSVALATRGGGTSNKALGRSVVVDPLFPITGLKLNGVVATFKSSATPAAVTGTIDWGDGATPSRGTIGRPVASGNGIYMRSVSGSHTYKRVATYDVTVTLRAADANIDTASNLAVVTDCFCVAKLPKFGSSVDLGPVSGTVSVKVPGAQSFAALTAPREIPVGSQIDATSGSLVVQAQTAAAGIFVAGEFDGGLFQILQAQPLGGLVDLNVRATNTTSCAAVNASPATQQKTSGRVLGLLHASVNGSFRTNGRYSAATVRGTEWTTTELCDGTLTRVQRGVVDVRDFRSGRTIVVPAGQSHLARSR